QLFDVPGLQPLRKQLLESALAYYQQFLARRGDDPALEGELAKSQYRVALIHRHLGANEQAASALLKARELYEGLTRQRPESVMLTKDLAQIIRLQGGLLHRSSRLPEALGLYQEARAILERLDREHPGVAQVQASLAMTCNDLGRVANPTSGP